MLGAAHSRTLAISSTARVQKIKKQPKRIKLNTPYIVEQLDAEMRNMELKSSSAFSSPSKSQGFNAAAKGFGAKPVASVFGGGGNPSGKPSTAPGFGSQN